MFETVLQIGPGDALGVDIETAVRMHADYDFARRWRGLGAVDWWLRDARVEAGGSSGGDYPDYAGTLAWDFVKAKRT